MCLEVYKEKVLEYESKDKNKITISESNGEAAADDNDNDDNEKEEENDGEDNDVDLEKITLDCIQHVGMLGESLSEFEEERLVILDQLKVLEDRLVTMQDNESAEDGQFSNSYEEQSYEHEGITMASMVKSLLPLLDEAENESEDGSQDLSESVEKESEKLEIIKKVDNVYERLQVLETDGEFLKGDKGTDLLKDILQHLRDLRTIELTDTIKNETTEDE